MENSDFSVQKHKGYISILFTPPKTNMPEDQWLEDEISF